LLLSASPRLCVSDEQFSDASDEPFSVAADEPFP
jgi:hypothetical protein